MAFIEIGFNTKRPLILGRGGFGTQLNDWLTRAGAARTFWTTTSPTPWAACGITLTLRF